MGETEKKLVMIVDDAELNREILTLILHEDYQIVEAENGLEAEEILKTESRKISLILLDIVMPVKDGFEFLTDIKKDERFNTIPIILVTSESYEENILKGIKMGVNDVIAKPFDPYLVRNRTYNLITLSEKREMLYGRAKENGSASQADAATMALIVDDVAINRAIVQTAIEDDYDILEAENGNEALTMLEKHESEIAIVLLDIIMPVMDGMDFMMKAKRRGLLDTIPVIAITSEDSPSKLKKMRELGVSEIIQKPFNPSVIKNRINYMIELSREGIV